MAEATGMGEEEPADAESKGAEIVRAEERSIGAGVPHSSLVQTGRRCSEVSTQVPTESLARQGLGYHITEASFRGTSNPRGSDPAQVPPTLQYYCPNLL